MAERARAVANDVHSALTPLLHTFHFQTSQYEIRYQLTRDGAGLVCRRERKQSCAFEEVVELPLFDCRTLKVFLDTDCELRFARTHGQRLIEAARSVVGENRANRAVPGRDAYELLRCAADIGEAKHLVDAHTLLRDAAQSVGMDGYAAMRGDWRSHQRTDVRWLAGTYPAWSQYVLQRHWYLNSALLQHARENDRLALGAQVPACTSGQREIVRAARTFGIRSRVVIPRVFAGAGARWDFGALIFYGQTEPAVGEKTAHAHATVLRGIATSFIDRWVALLERQRVSTVVLTQFERSLLELVRRGVGANEVAAQLGLTTACVNNHYRRINEKFGVHDKHAALAIAVAHGLMPPRYLSAD